MDEFMNIYNKTMGSVLDDTTKEEFTKVISDPNMEYIEYEKFNRLCDIYFYMPGQIFK